MKNNNLLKNYFYNTFYHVLILLAPLVTAPYLARVLGAESIGIYSYTNSITVYFVLFGAVGTSLYGQREVAYCQKDVQARSNIFWEVQLFRFLASSLCFFVFFFIFGYGREYSYMYRILSIEIVTTGLDVSWFYMGMENFRITVLRSMILRILGIILVFVLVKSPSDVTVYALCLVLPALIGSISLWLPLKKYLVKPSENVLFNIPKHLRTIVVLFIPQVAVEVYIVLDKTMIGKLCPDIEQVAYYHQSQKIVKLVLAVITSVGTVMLPAMSAAFAQRRNDEIVRKLKTVFRYVFLLASAMIFGIAAVSDRFVPLYFGDGYSSVAMLMVVISPIILLIGTSNVIGRQYLLPTKQQKAFTISVCTGAVVNFTLNLFLIRQYYALGASIATVIAELAVTLVQIWFVRRQLPLLECFAAIPRYIIEGLIMYFAVWGLGKCFPDNSLLSLVIMVCTGVLVYLLELLITRDEILKMALGRYKKKHIQAAK